MENINDLPRAEQPIFKFRILYEFRKEVVENAQKYKLAGIKNFYHHAIKDFYKGRNLFSLICSGGRITRTEHQYLANDKFKKKLVRMRPVFIRFLRPII